MSDGDDGGEKARGGPERTTRIALALATVASVGLVVALAIVRYLPTHDGPQHLFLGYLENHIADPGRGWEQVYERSPQITAMGFTVVFSLLESWLPWRGALTASLAIIVLIWSWGFVALCSALNPRRTLVGVLGFGCALSWALYMGFFSFVLSTGLGFFTLALALREPRWPALRRVAIAALLTLQAVAHLFPAQLVGLTLLFVVVLRPGGPRIKLRELGLLAVMGLPALAITALAFGATRSPLHATHWLLLGDRVRLWGAAFVSGPLWRAWPPVLLAAVGIGATLRRARTSLRDGDVGQRDALALAITACLLFAVSLASPLDFNLWQFFSPRLLPLATMLGLALLPVERLPDDKRLLAAGAAGVLALSSIAWAGAYHRELERRTQDAFAGLDAPLSRSGPRLTVVLDPFAGPPAGIYQDEWRHADVPFVTPLWNMAMVYAVAQGGIPAWSFTSRPRLLPFVMREQARASLPPVHDPIQAYDPRILGDPSAREALVTWLGELGTRYEDIIVYGEPRDGDVLEARGYHADFRQGGLYLGRFVGCPVTLRIVAATALPARLIVQYGWDRARPPANEYVIPAGTAPEYGGYQISPRTCFCGATWYRVALDLDHSDTASVGDRFCAGAGPDGIVPVQAEPGPASTLICELGSD